MPSYAWITYLGAIQTLAARLADSGMVFWTKQELQLYLKESLRMWNALTEIWNADFAFQATSTNTWYNLASLAGSPRLRTLTDSDLYTIMQYHLLEPPTGGGIWTGTAQFSLPDLQGALQRRRDEVIQASGCNLKQLPPLPSTPNVRRTFFPDSTLEPIRARFLPATGFGDPITLTREDNQAFNAFEPDHLQTPAYPNSWDVVDVPPLALDADVPPSVPGAYDVISLQAGPTFAPPAATLLAVPDDWAWVVKWGALADLLSRDSEATDRERADYCLKRYMDGLRIMKASNWLVSATISGVPVDTPSLREMDAFLPEWELTATAWPALVQAGMDMAAPCPVAVAPVGVSCVLVGNAPCPILDGDFVQISRDNFDAVLAYAQVLAMFKMGGQEFADAKDLEQSFYAAAMDTNKRLVKMGVLVDTIHQEGQRQNIAQPR